MGINKLKDKRKNIMKQESLDKVKEVMFNPKKETLP